MPFQIIQAALENLQNEIRSKPLCFELLAKKFTLRQMQNIYESVPNINLDNRNFRKKIPLLEFLIPLPEKEQDINHKPAQLYRFDKHLYAKNRKLKSDF